MTRSGVRPFRLFLIALCLELVLSLYFQASLTRFEDIAGHLNAAARILHGSRLYVDILSVCLPITFYLRIPGVWLAERYSLNALQVAVLFDNLMALLSIGLALFILRKTLFGRGWQLASMLLCLVGIAFVLPYYDNVMGQKEYFFFLCSLPYFLLVAAETEGAGFNARFKVFIGIFSVLGFAYKPFFILPLLLVEAYLCIRARNWRSILRPEAVACAACGLAYLAWALPLYAPMLKLTGFYYEWRGAFADIAKYFALHMAPFLLPNIALWAYAQRQKIPHLPFLQVCMLVFLGNALETVAQLKTVGFEYHFFPFIAMGLVTMTAGCIILRKIGRRYVLWGAYVLLASMTLYATALVFNGAQRYAVKQEHRLILLKHIMALAGQQPSAANGVYIFGLLLTPIFPEGPMWYGLPWDYHFYDQWLHEGIVHYQRHHPEMSRAEIDARTAWADTFLRHTVTDDLERIRPAVIMINHNREKYFFGYYSQYAPFAQCIAHYELKETFQGKDLYVRKPDATPPSKEIP